MADRTRTTRKISDEVLDELLAGQDAAEVFRSGTLIDDLKKAVAERALDAEMAAHLEREGDAGNHRNGHNRKRVLTGSGAMDLEVPRDRLGRFEPQLVEKYARRLPGFDDKVVSMYARGMTTREIQGHVRELYGLDVSPELVSKVTDAVHDEIREWQARPLDDVYAIVYFDAVRAKIRDEGLVKSKAVYLGIGVTCAGRKKVLGLWIEQTEGARFWFAVMNELKARGLQDVLIAVVDGLKGFPEAIESVYPEATVQTCIVHLIRHSLAYAGWKERKALASALKAVYQAPTEAAAASALDAFEAGPWGGKYPGIVRSWRSAWDRVVPFFAFSAPIRRAIYTTNAIESLNSTVRRAIRTRGHFPNDRAERVLVDLRGPLRGGGVVSGRRVPAGSGRGRRRRQAAPPRAMLVRATPSLRVARGDVGRTRRRSSTSAAVQRHETAGRRRLSQEWPTHVIPDTPKPAATNPYNNIRTDLRLQCSSSPATAKLCVVARPACPMGLPCLHVPSVVHVTSLRS